MGLTLDGVANDGSTEDDNGSRRDDIKADVEKVTGGRGADTITGSAAANVIDGYIGNDLIDGGAGADDIIGGGGVDRVTYASRTAGVTVTLAGGADDGNAVDDNGTRRDDLQQIEAISATTFNDTLTGNTGSNGVLGTNVLSGNSGDDVISGLDGPDVLVGGFGADDIGGGAGTDTTTYGAGYVGEHFADLTVTLEGTANDGSTEDDNGSRRDNINADVENITGSRGNDSIEGSSAANVLVGGLGADELIGLDGNDRLRARDGAVDVRIDCDGGTTPGATDVAETDVSDPAPTGCESVMPG